MMQNVQTLIMATRPSFLLLSLAVVLMGTMIAVYEGASWSWSIFFLILFGALLSHMAVNLLNEYQDFASGLDSLTEKTPFSGGSGALIDHPEAAPLVKKLFLVVVVILVAIGALLVQHSGWLLLVMGGVGLSLIVLYTKVITKMPWVCLFSPGLAFGPLMVMGTYYVWTGTVSGIAILLSLVPFFLVNNLLLMNQIPDIEADKKVGRYNILMHLGLENGIQIFAAFNWLAYISLGVTIWLYELPQEVWLGFLTLLIVFPMLHKVQLTYDNVEKLMPVLGMNVIINLTTPLLIAVGLFISLDLI